MFLFDAETAAHHAARPDIVAHALVWITARDRTTGAPASVGFWTGDADRSFTIDGAPRLYHGAGAVIEIDDVVAGIGLETRILEVRLSNLTEAFFAASALYDPRRAPVEIHRAEFHPVTRALIGVPHRRFRGRVVEFPETEGAAGGEGGAVLRLASAVDDLRRTLSLRKSDASHRLRFPGDGIRRYGAIATAVPVAWGEIYATAPAAPPPPADSRDPADGGGIDIRGP
ncbi:MAG: hypothetical protein ACK4QW_16020 [Alphaproteobacteria bacterium]